MRVGQSRESKRSAGHGGPDAAVLQPHEPRQARGAGFAPPAALRPFFGVQRGEKRSFQIARHDQPGVLEKKTMMMMMPKKRDLSRRRHVLRGSVRMSSVKSEIRFRWVLGVVKTLSDSRHSLSCGPWRYKTPSVVQIEIR